MITDKALDYLVIANREERNEKKKNYSIKVCQYRELIINYNGSFNLHSFFIIFTLNELNVACIVNTNKHNNYMNKGSVES